MTEDLFLKTIGDNGSKERSAFNAPLFGVDLPNLGVSIPWLRTFCRKHPEVDSKAIPLGRFFEWNLAFFFLGIQKKKFEDQLLFLKEHGQDLLTWAITDSLAPMVEKVSPSVLLSGVKDLLGEKETYVRRLAYVLLRRLSQDSTKKILPLLRKEKERTLIQAQSWLLADCAVFSPEAVLSFLKKRRELCQTTLSKMRDSRRIDREVLHRFRQELSEDPSEAGR